MHSWCAPCRFACHQLPVGAHCAVRCRLHFDPAIAVEDTDGVPGRDGHDARHVARGVLVESGQERGRGADPSAGMTTPSRPLPTNGEGERWGLPVTRRNVESPVVLAGCCASRRAPGSACVQHSAATSVGPTLIYAPSRPAAATMARRRRCDSSSYQYAATCHLRSHTRSRLAADEAGSAGQRRGWSRRRPAADFLLPAPCSEMRSADRR